MSLVSGFLMAAALAASPPQTAPAAAPVRAQARATVTILRAETATPDTPPGGTARRVSRRSDGQVNILFE